MNEICKKCGRYCKIYTVNGSFKCFEKLSSFPLKCIEHSEPINPFIIHELIKINAENIYFGFDNSIRFVDDSCVKTNEKIRDYFSQYFINNKTCPYYIEQQIYYWNKKNEY